TRIERLKEQISACRIRAPQAGTVLYSHETWGRRGETTAIRPGIVVRNRQPLLEVVDAEHFKLHVPVSADLARRVETGAKVTVRVDALPSRTFEGLVAEVGPLPRPRGSARNLIVVRVDDPSGDLRVGMTAMLEFGD
ncbi:MAG: HlyD family secretion protein, partial [Sedimentisphaerales bacterium]|nr:HlyD family secretion protein [Sedimentisphaerales bacterium]